MRQALQGAAEKKAGWLLSPYGEAATGLDVSRVDILTNLERKDKGPLKLLDPYRVHSQVAQGEQTAALRPNAHCMFFHDACRHVIAGHGHLMDEMQVALYAAAELKSRVRGVTLLNCSGAMNQRGLYQDDATLAALKPVFWVVESLLKRKGIATWLFEKFR